MAMAHACHPVPGAPRLTCAAAHRRLQAFSISNGGEPRSRSLSQGARVPWPSGSASPAPQATRAAARRDGLSEATPRALHTATPPSMGAHLSPFHCREQAAQARKPPGPLVRECEQEKSMLRDAMEAPSCAATPGYSARCRCMCQGQCATRAVEEQYSFGPQGTTAAGSRGGLRGGTVGKSSVGERPR